MLNINAQFAVVLVKYLEAGKLNDSKLVTEFIELYRDSSVEYSGIPESPTKEMIDFAKSFIKKKVKCSDFQFSERMVEISTSQAFVEQTIAQIAAVEQRATITIYRGEY